MIRLLLGLALLGSPAQMEGLPRADVPAVQGSVLADSELDRQTRELASQLRCVVCQGLSIQDSPSSLAQEMRAVVREQLAAGRSPAEVKRYFVDKYGEFVLLQPEPTGFNLVVYVLPVVMLLGGAAFVFFKAKQWTARTNATETL